MKNPLKTFIAPYDFAEGLPASLTFADLDFFHPVVKVGIAVYISIAKLQTRQTKTPNFPMETGTGKVNVYTVQPEDAETRPAILYCHGGGFMFPLQPCMINNSKLFVEQTGCRVFLPDYRYAPKDPFPTPFEDCYQTYLYLLDHASELHIDPDNILIYGDSAGGALAAAVCQKARDEGVKAPIAQMLIYPVTDCAQDTKSLDEFAYGSWSRTSNKHMWKMYLANGDGGHLAYAAPNRASDFSGLPKAYVEPAGMDALRDEGIDYAEKMKAAGVDVTLRIVDGAYHGFDQRLDLSFTQNIMAERIAWMKAL